jgi:hypothetical protein
LRREPGRAQIAQPAVRPLLIIPALTRHLHPAYSVIEEIVEGFVEGSLFEAVDFKRILFDI